jgi:hypothetical protein
VASSEGGSGLGQLLQAHQELRLTCSNFLTDGRQKMGLDEIIRDLCVYQELDGLFRLMLVEMKHPMPKHWTTLEAIHFDV